MNIHGTCTTSTGARRETFSTSVEKLKEVIEALKVPEHPILVWMRHQGRPPEQWQLFLPASLMLEFDGAFIVPDAVSFNKLLKGGEVIFVKRNLHLDTKYGPLELKGNL